jgi:hypothetical protein
LSSRKSAKIPLTISCLRIRQDIKIKEDRG